MINGQLKSSTTDDGLAPGHDYERSDTKPSLPAREHNLDEFDGLIGIERKATEEQEPNINHTLPEERDNGVTATLEEVSKIIHQNEVQ